VTQIIAFEGDGVLREYAGGYSDWASHPSRTAAPQGQAIGSPVIDKAVQKSGRPGPRNAARSSETGLSFNEQRELSSLPARIEALEARIAELRNRLADPALYRESPEQVKALHAKLAQVDAELALVYARWEELEKRGLNSG
jgi:ATP-binding cassette subfamily F protein uup